MKVPRIDRRRRRKKVATVNLSVTPQVKKPSYYSRFNPVHRRRGLHLGDQGRGGLQADASVDAVPAEAVLPIRMVLPLHRGVVHLMRGLRDDVDLPVHLSPSIQVRN